MISVKSDRLNRLRSWAMTVHSGASGISAFEAPRYRILSTWSPASKPRLRGFPLLQVIRQSGKVLPSVHALQLVQLGKVVTAFEVVTDAG